VTGKEAVEAEAAAGETRAGAAGARGHTKGSRLTTLTDTFF
jgi:hypothetical protein